MTGFRLARRLGAALCLWLVGGVASGAADFPDWAYTVTPPPSAHDATVAKQIEGSDRHYTEAQVEDDFAPPDWFPADHPIMPSVVANGRPPAVKACSKCHVTNGAGHPESSDLAGMTPAYIAAQVADMKDGLRKGRRAGSMMPIVKALTDEEVAAAAAYYTALKPVLWTKVVESETVPKSYVGTGGMRFPLEPAGDEPLGDRIIELPQAPARMELRDSRSGFIAYVPKGSLARGETLVKAGGKTTACATCHGADLKGAGDVPRIVGRSPSYVFRQMNDIKTGMRAGPHAEPMQKVVADLDAADMLAISAYLAAQQP